MNFEFLTQQGGGSTVKISEAVLYFYGINARGFTLRAKNLMATLNLADSGSFPVLGAYKAGEVINISGTLAGEQTLHSGPAYYDGKRYPKLFYEGSLVFNANRFALPPDSSHSVSIRVPFAFTGNLKAYESSNISGGGGPAVFDVVLSGKGQATANFGASYNVGSGRARDILTLFYYFLPFPRIAWLFAGT